MARKKAKRKRAGVALAPEIAAAVKGLLGDLRKHEEEREPLETSLHVVRSQLGMSGERDMALVDALGGDSTERSARLLQALLDSASDKRVVKGIKRSLYRLDQQGVSIEPVGKTSQGPSILRPLAEEQTKGLISAVDAEGGQVLFLTLSRKPKGLYLLQGIVSDTRGLMEFNRVETTKRGFREFYQSIREPGQLPIVEVDPGYCRFRLEEAVQLNESRGEPPPVAYLSAKRDLQRLEKSETPPVFLSLNEKKIHANPRFLKNSADLFETDLFSSWFLPREEMQKYADLIAEAEESRLVLNPAQKEARLQETYRKALAELFPEERRQLYRRRLEEMAYVLLKDGREDNAKAALAASIDLRSILTSLEPNPFLLNLLIRSIYVIMAQEMEKKKTEPSLIVKP
jgi:hypothetical protein